MWKKSNIKIQKIQNHKIQKNTKKKKKKKLQTCHCNIIEKIQHIVTKKYIKKIQKNPQVWFYEKYSTQNKTT